MIDAGKHRVLVYISLIILVITMTSYIFLTTGAHLLIAGFFLVSVTAFCSHFSNLSLPVPHLRQNEALPMLPTYSPTTSALASAPC